MNEYRPNPSIGVRANFFLGAEASLSKNFFDNTRKNCHTNLQNYSSSLILPSN